MELSKEEEAINRKLKQTLSHHINIRREHVSESTSVEDLRRFYYELMEIGRAPYPFLSAANLYHLRCLVINGLCKTQKTWKELLAALELEDVTEKDMPDFTQVRAAADPAAAYVFRATYGIKMPYMGGGSVVFSVSSDRSSSGSLSGKY